MEQLLQQMKAVLNDEKQVMSDMLILSKKKTEVLVNSDTKTLEQIVDTEQILISKLGTLEREREKIVSMLQNEVGAQNQAMTLSDFIEKSTGSLKQELKECQSTLQGIMEEQKNMNERNTKLIENHLDFVDYMVNLYTSTPNQNAVYGGDGHTHVGGKRRAFFDNKA